MKGCGSLHASEAKFLISCATKPLSAIGPGNPVNGTPLDSTPDLTWLRPWPWDWAFDGVDLP